MYYVIKRGAAASSCNLHLGHPCNINIRLFELAPIIPNTLVQKTETMHHQKLITIVFSHTRLQLTTFSFCRSNNKESTECDPFVDWVEYNMDVDI